MVDTPKGTPEQLAAKEQELIDTQQRLTAATGSYNDVLEQSESILGKWGAKLNATGASLDQLGELAAENTAVFTGLGLAMIKAQDTTAGLGAALGGTSDQIMTFSGQFNDLKEMFASGSLAGKEAASALEALKKQYRDMGGSESLLTEALKKGAGAVVDLTKSLFQNADRAIASQEAILQTAAATGQLGLVTEKAGEQLQNMNVLLDMYNEIQGQAKGETNSNVAQINQYSTALLQIPGAMNSVISSATTEGKSMSGLSAMIKLSHGTHRDFNKVVDDVKHSMVNYGSSLEDSMKLTSRLTELTNKTGAQFDDMRSGVLSVTDAFSKMTNAGDAAGKMQESISQMMADYVTRLKETGMPAKQAIELVGNLGQQFGNLSTAQKAFLSAQTGGPGGLMGSIQIDKMIREGDFAGLRKKMTDILQKQIGTVVTQEEGSKSEAAASMLIRQRALMRQGPMGQMFKTDQDADRFAEAMKAEKEGRPLPGGGSTKLDDMGLQKTIEKGSTWEAKTHTQVNNIATHAHRIRTILETNSLGAVQQNLTAAVTPDKKNASQQSIADDLTASLNKFGLRGAAQADVLHDEMKKGSGELSGDLRKTHTKDAVDDFMVDLKKLPTVLRSVFNTMSDSFDKGDTKAVNQGGQALVKDIEERRSAANRKGISEEEKKKLLESAQMEEDKYKEWVTQHNLPMQGRGRATGTPSLPPGASPRANLGPLPRTGVQTPGAAVGAAQRPTATRTGTTGESTGTPDVQPNVTINKNAGRINVNVHVDVKDNGGQAASSAPQGGTHGN